MPEVSGYDVLRDLALTGTAKGLPVIVLTNEPGPGTRRAALARAWRRARRAVEPAFTSIRRCCPRRSSTISRLYQDLDALDAPPLEVERFRAEVPEGDAADAAALGVERFAGPEPAAENAPTPASEPITGAVDEDHRRAA